MDLTAEERTSDSPFIDRIWRSQSEQSGSFISMAEIHFNIVVTKYQGKLTFTVRGPETRATPACTLQRRLLQATGITYGTVSQIQRARYATTLLKQGVSILDTVDQAGYADQPHLTRSLKHFVGQTPAQIISESRREALSFLFKTTPF